MSGDLADLERVPFPAGVQPGALCAIGWPPAAGMRGRIVAVAADRLSARARLDDASEVELTPGDLYLLADPRGYRG